MLHVLVILQVVASGVAANNQRQEFIAGVRDKLSIRLTGSVLWTPRLFRAGRVRVRPHDAACGSVGSSYMSHAVQPPCAGSVCLGPIKGGNNEAYWQGVRIVRAGIYKLCWCEPDVSCAGADAGYNGKGCCHEDKAFSTPVGELQVRGPKWFSFNVMLGEPFDIDLEGVGVTRSSRVMLRIRKGFGAGSGAPGGMCGYTVPSSERKAGEVEMRYERGQAYKKERATFTARVFRRMTYTVCWCAGEKHTVKAHQACNTDEAFSAEVGYIHPHGPETESVPVTKAVVGGPFSLTLHGDRLGTGDRVRIIDNSRSCGDAGSKTSIAVSRAYCKTSVSCVTSPIRGWPPNFFSAVSPKMSETWYPAVVISPGLYKICWCVDNTYDPEKFESHGLCASDNQFAVAVGMLFLEGIDDKQSFVCEAFVPCTIRVASHRKMNARDGIYIAALTSNTAVACGSGMRGVQLLATSVDNAIPNKSSGTFDIKPHAGPPGVFQLCYCQSSIMGVCDDIIDFAQPAGKLRVSAPSSNRPMHQEAPKYCHVGFRCAVSVLGMWASQLNKADAFRIVPLQRRCGEGSSIAAPSIFHLTSREKLVTGQWEARFHHAADWVTKVGDYRLCYCSIVLVPGQTPSCDAARFFSQDVGKLHVLGVIGSHEWDCSQGSPCNISVPGWSFRPGDSVLLLSGQLSTCGLDIEGAVSRLTLGFVSNPINVPVVKSTVGGDEAEFVLGQADGAGESRVCFCAADASQFGCKKVVDFIQDVGKLNVAGPITSVYALASQPATASVISLVADARVKGSVHCAVTASALKSPPTIWEVLYCRERLPSCVGYARLPWQATLGPNVIHVPIELNRSRNASSPLPTGHAWCVGDFENCPRGRCAIPPTGEGQLLQLQDGSVFWTRTRKVRGEAFNFTIEGNPLNTQGYLAVLDYQDECGSGPLALFLGPSAVTLRYKSARWNDVVIEKLGQYRLCWCDRGYGNDCMRWHDAGLVVIAGPAFPGEDIPYVNPGKSYTLNLTGVDLTMAGHVFTMSGSGCPNASVAWQNASFPMQAFGGSASWNLTAPNISGNFTLCWSEENSALSLAVGNLEVIERQDCLLSNWSAGPCDKPCGNGTALETRYVVAWPRGGGLHCPSASLLVRVKPCNTQRCPAVTALRSWTVPAVVQTGDAFRVMVEGFDFTPTEDRIMLLSGDSTCGDSEAFLTGSSCDWPGSNGTYLVCGDGEYTMRVAEPGLYRVCLCDGSMSSVLKNGTYVSCGSASEFNITPTNGSLFPTLGPRMSWSEFDARFRPVDEDDSRTGVLGRTRIEPQVRDASTQRLVVILSVIAAVLHILVAVCVWWCWIRRRRAKKEKERPVKVIDTNEIVRQATREVWNAYARSIAEGVDDEELVQASYDILEANAAAEEAEKPQRRRSRSRLPLQDGSGDENSDSSTASPSSPSRGTTPQTRGSTPQTRGSTPGTARSKTPPGTGRSKTPPGTAGTDRTSRTPPPGSREPTPPRPHSQRSFFQVPLQPQGAPTPPKEGGSFLDMPLLGNPTAPPPAHSRPSTSGAQSRPSTSGVSNSRPSTSGISNSRPSTSGISSTEDDRSSSSKRHVPQLNLPFGEDAMKRSGSSWRSSSYTHSSSLSDTSQSLSPRSGSESAPMAPRGRPPPRLPKLEPLHLPPSSSPESEDRRQPGTPQHDGSPEVATLERAPPPITPLGNMALSSSAARPPGCAPASSLPRPPEEGQQLSPEAPPQPPPEQLLDIMGWRAHLADLPPPPPPPISGRTSGQRPEADLFFHPPGGNREPPKAPPLPPPNLPMQSKVPSAPILSQPPPTPDHANMLPRPDSRDSWRNDASPRAQTPLADSRLSTPAGRSSLDETPALPEPPTRADSAPSSDAGASRTRASSFTSMFSGLRFPRPWSSGSRSASRKGSGQVTALPRTAEKSESVGSPLAKHPPSAPEAKPHPHCIGEMRDLSPHAVVDVHSTAAARLPTQEPLQGSVGVESALREAASGQDSASVEPSLRDIASGEIEAAHAPQMPAPRELDSQNSLGAASCEASSGGGEEEVAVRKSSEEAASSESLRKTSKDAPSVVEEPAKDAASFVAGLFGKKPEPRRDIKNEAASFVRNLSKAPGEKSADSFVASLRKTPADLAETPSSNAPVPSPETVNEAQLSLGNDADPPNEGPQSGEDALPVVSENVPSEPDLPTDSTAAEGRLVASIDAIKEEEDGTDDVPMDSPRADSELSQVIGKPASVAGSQTSFGTSWSQSTSQGRYVPGPASNGPPRRTSFRRNKPRALGDVGEHREEWTGPRWTGRETNPDEPEVDARAEFLEAQEKIKKDWHDRLKAETDWSKEPSPKASLGRRDMASRDRLRSSMSSFPKGSAPSSQASSALPSPRGSSASGPGPPLLGGPGPPLPGGPGPPLPGGPGPPLPGGGPVPSRIGSPMSSQGGRMLPGPPMHAPKGPGPSLLPGSSMGPGPPMGGPNPHARAPTVGRKAPSWAFVAP